MQHVDGTTGEIKEDINEVVGRVVKKKGVKKTSTNEEAEILLCHQCNEDKPTLWRIWSEEDNKVVLKCEDCLSIPVVLEKHKELQKEVEEQLALPDEPDEDIEVSMG